MIINIFLIFQVFFMFSFIRGTVIATEMTSASILVEKTGLGLEIFISPQTLSGLRSGDNVELWLHHHITEVSQTLFGFLEISERSLFRSLIRVSGIGGKTALNMLALGSDTLLTAIENEDDKILASIPGIGKKTAQKIIVDLKGSIHFSGEKNGKNRANITENSPLFSSLVAMGYDKNRVESIIETLDPALPLEEQVKIAIKSL